MNLLCGTLWCLLFKDLLELLDTSINSLAEGMKSSKKFQSNVSFYFRGLWVFDKNYRPVIYLSISTDFRRNYLSKMKQYIVLRATTGCSATVSASEFSEYKNYLFFESILYFIDNVRFENCILIVVSQWDFTKQ